MSEGELFMLMLATLYLAECATFVSKDTVALLAPWLRWWRVAYPSGLFGSGRLGVVMNNPIPPLGTVFFCQAWPFSLSSEGLYAYTALTFHPEGRLEQDRRFVPWPEVQNVAVREKRVMLNGGKLFRADSAAQALVWATLISTLAKLPAELRAEAIDQALKGALDHDAVARRIEEYRRRARWLQGTCMLMFVFIFVACPWVGWNLGLMRTWPHLLGGLVLLLVAIATLFNRSHRALYPDAKEERTMATCLAATVPTITIRAHDYLARPLLAGCHPLAAAHVLLDAERFRTFARRVLLDARQPILPECPSQEPVVRATEAWSRERQRAALERFVKQQGLNVDELIQPPQARDEASRSYCPRCDNQFVLTGGTCQDCGGIPLRPLQARI